MVGVEPAGGVPGGRIVQGFDGCDGVESPSRPINACCAALPP